MKIEEGNKMNCINPSKHLQLYICKIKSGYVCWNCKKTMDILIICELDQVDFDMCSCFAYEKPDNIINIAKLHGVKMEKRYVKFTREEYIAHVCPHCNVVQGDNSVVLDNHQFDSITDKEVFKILYNKNTNMFILPEQHN